MNKENKVKFLLKKAFIAPATIAEDGTVTYGTPKREPGAVSISLSAKGSMQSLRADGVDYYTSNSNDGYEGDLEFAKISADFERDYLGATEDENGVQFERTDDESKPFALLLEFTGDKRAVRHCLYLCYASRPAIEGSNPDNTKTPQTEKVTIKAVPREDGFIKANTRGTTSEETYNKWYDAVPEFTKAASEG